MRITVTRLLAALALICTLTPTTTYSQSTCRFVLGFATLRDLVGAQKVGNCLEDEHFNLENGNAEQRTSGGLLVWRKADNFTAFTDGGTTWVNGPNGLQSRPNGERFAWEKDPVQAVQPARTPQLTVTAATPTLVARIEPPTPTMTPRPAPTAAPAVSSAPDPRLMSKCVSLAGDLAEELNQELPVGSSAGGKAFEAFLGLCQIAVKQHGDRGYTCFESAFRRSLRLNRQVRPGSTVALDAARAEYALCVSDR